MSWGCAEVVCEMVLQHGIPDAVAVLGAGVMGLTAATLITERNIPVTVYAEKFTPCTTSDVAGGQWAPSFINYERNDSAKKQAYFDVLRRARKAHENRGPGFGVSQRWNYTINEVQHLKELPPDIVPPPTMNYCDLDLQNWADAYWCREPPNRAAHQELLHRCACPLESAL
jgi:D-amino-acid oxidase